MKSSSLFDEILLYFIRLLTRKGYLIEEQGITYLAETDSDLTLAPLQSAACTYRIALGPRADQKVLSLETVPTQKAQSTAERCVSEHGFSLHADVHCTVNQRNQFERRCSACAVHACVRAGTHRQTGSVLIRLSSIAFGNSQICQNICTHQVYSLHKEPKIPALGRD